MNMGLLAADLSLGGSVKESGSVAVRHHDKQHFVYPVSPCDLRALEVYHKALEDERLKIQAFERELPFCMQLLENAIEASKEQLEERLACKLNTPLHEPQLTAATHEFVCNYTSSLSHRSLLPALGEINLRFKRKYWTSTPSASTVRDRGPHPYNHVASTCTTKWLLPQNTKLTQNEDTPITCIKGSIKVQEFSIPEHAQPAADEGQKTISEIGWRTKSMPFPCINATPNHALHLCDNALHLRDPTQALSSVGHPQTQEEKYMLGKMQDVYDRDEDHCTPAISVRSRNDAACLEVNGSPNTYSRPLCHANLIPKELQIHSTLSSPFSKGSSHCNNTALQSVAGVQRKPRRCWSPELHQRFLSALNHLGGCQVATPKQIRELMNVEGLTNDEVKSHLQKFRLHMRRVPHGVLANSQGDSQQAAAGRHLVVFGHIWVPPEYGDERHQHSTNANIDIISNDLSAANGAMGLMKSFRSSGTRITSIEHEDGSHDSSVQHDIDGVAQAGLLRLGQEEYCSDQEEMYESKRVYEIDRHNEGNIDSNYAADVESERARSIICRQRLQLQGGRCDGDDHVGYMSGQYRCANKDEAPSQEEYRAGQTQCCVSHGDQ